MDFSDNEWHITLEGTIKLCNAYPNAKLIPIHWGSVDAPDWSTFNGNPEELRKNCSSGAFVRYVTGRSLCFINRKV